MLLPLHRGPGIYRISLLVQDGQSGPFQLLPGCQVRLFNGDRGRLIFKFTGHFYRFHILPLIGYREIHGLVGRNIARRCFLLPDIILSKWQFQIKDGFSILSCGCFPQQGICLYDGFSTSYNVSFCIQAKYSSLDHASAAGIFLYNGDFRFLQLIFKLCGLLHHRRILILISQGDGLCRFI